jgi:molybdopterin-guanine dinucleotide biosynthesis protein A
MALPPPVPALAAIVLAGGGAARLGGADKPALAVGGRPLLALVAEAAVAARAGQIVIVGPQRPGLPLDADQVPVTWVREDPPGSGPVAALRRGLSATGAHLALVLAADLPFLGGRPLAALIAAATGTGEVTPARPETAAPGSGRPGARPAASLDRTCSAEPCGTGDMAGPWPVGPAAGGLTAPGHPGAAGAVLVDGGGRAQWLAGCWRTGALREALAGYQGRSLHGLLEPLGPVLLRWAVADGEPPPWLDCDTPEALERARAWAGS